MSPPEIRMSPPVNTRHVSCLFPTYRLQSLAEATRCVLRPKNTVKAMVFKLPNP